MIKTNYINEGFIIKNPDGEDEIIQIPYNLNNILVNESDIIQILNTYNVKLDKINHIEYFQQAFTHKSYCKKDIYPQHILDAAKDELGNPPELLDLFEKSYERLEYFGDRVLKVIVSMYLFHRYPRQDEGFMTRLQTKIEDKKNLSIMSKEIGLSKYFIISKQIESMNGRSLEKIHEDVFESFIGALFLSNGFEPCMFLIVNLLETLIDYSEKLYCDNNYKDQLLRVHHQNKWKFPEYVTIHFEGPPHKRKYIMGVEKQDSNESTPLENRCISFGIGSSKKEGEQNAAKMALIIHGILKQDQYSSSDIYYPPWDKIATFDGETMIIKSPDSETNDNTFLPQISDHDDKTKQNEFEENDHMEKPNNMDKSEEIKSDEETKAEEETKVTETKKPKETKEVKETKKEKVVKETKKPKETKKEKEVKEVKVTKKEKVAKSKSSKTKKIDYDSDTSIKSEKSV